MLVYAWAVLRPDFAEAAKAGGSLGRAYQLAGGSACPSLVKVAAVATGLGATLVMLYTGVEVMVVAARPLWHTPFLPAQFLATALAGSVGLVLVFNRILGGGDSGAEVALNRTLARMLAAVLVLGVLWMLLALSGLSPAHSDALARVASSPSWQLTAVWAVTATLVPLVLAWRRPSGTGLLTGLIALHSAWMFRWTIFIGGQDIPKTGAGFYDYHLPLGPEGLLGIVGTAGLWFAVLILLTSVLPRIHTVKAVAVLRHGVRAGVLAVEHGFGHKEHGARAHRLGDKSLPVIPDIAAGINLNDLGLRDPTRKGDAVWVDPMSGTAVRQGLPAKVEKV